MSYIIFHKVIDGDFPLSYQVSSEVLDDIDDLNSVLGSMQSIAQAKGYKAYLADVYAAQDCIMHTDLETGRVDYSPKDGRTPQAEYSRELK